MNILILSALQSEVEQLIKLHNPEIFFKTPKISILNKKIGNNNFYFVVSGVGSEKVSKFFEMYVRLNINADLIVSIGYAGAMDPFVNVGDIVIAKYYYQNEITNFSENNNDLNKENRIILVHEYKIKPQVGYRLLTGLGVNKVVSRNEKKFLKKYYSQANFVDMESCEIIKICNEYNIKFMILRVISDSFDFNFPRYEFIKDSWKKIKISKFILYILSNPINFFKVFFLIKNIKIANQNLFRAMDGLINRFENINNI